MISKGIVHNIVATTNKTVSRALSSLILQRVLCVTIDVLWFTEGLLVDNMCWDFFYMT